MEFDRKAPHCHNHRNEKNKKMKQKDDHFSSVSERLLSTGSAETNRSVNNLVSLNSKGAVIKFCTSNSPEDRFGFSQ